MSDATRRTARHESQHATVAFYSGLRVDKVTLGRSGLGVAT
jgi:hypothetical protein